MAETTEKVENGSDPRRRVLNIAVSTVLLETGFDAADKMALETLTEIMQCCKQITIYFLQPKLYKTKIFLILTVSKYDPEFKS